MRYRKLSDTGDYTFGQGSRNFWINVPEAVAQAIKTRLLLLTGEWFLDTSEGTPYSTQILGKNTGPTRDLAMKSRILKTPGVREMLLYASSVEDRDFTVQTKVQTVYGQSEIIPVTAP